jgi:hypothetical protein
MIQRRKRIEEQRVRAEQEKEARLNRLKSTVRVRGSIDPLGPNSCPKRSRKTIQTH